MKILIITDCYPPEVRSSSHLMVELASELAFRGHEVYVVTGMPDRDLMLKSQIPLVSPYTLEAAVHVLRVKTPSNHNVGYIRRAFAELIMPLLFFIQIKKHRFDRVDVVLSYSPPLLLSLLGHALKSSKRRFVLNVQDLFPQNAIDLGIIKSKWVIALFQAIEKFLYQSADCVTFHSESNLSDVKSRLPSLNHAKFRVLANWVDVSPFLKPSKSNYRSMYRLHQNQFVILFAGVMGPSQDLMRILELAQSLHDLHDVVFLLVGDGSEKKRLIAYANQKNITNVVFKDFVSKDEYPSLVSACDVGLVSLSCKNTTPVVPGKILGYMAAKKPILAFLHARSDAHALVHQARCGFTSLSDSISGMRETFMLCYQQRNNLPHMGVSGFDYLQHHYSVSHCVDTLNAYIGEIA